MLIFVLSFIATAIISLCFFKSKFWENRYLVLLIGTGVALVATLTTNYIVRGKLSTKTEIAWQIPIKSFLVHDAMFSDSTSVFKDQKYEFTQWKGEIFMKVDTAHAQRKLSIVFFGKATDRYIGYIKENNSTHSYALSEIYFAPSNTDSTAYIIKKKLKYDVKPNNWITGFSFPRKGSYTCICIPPKELALIPDSLIKKLPF
jgi:hypothetical protein